jgi:hypothetical protein
MIKSELLLELTPICINCISKRKTAHIAIIDKAMVST